MGGDEKEVPNSFSQPQSLLSSYQATQISITERTFHEPKTNECPYCLFLPTFDLWHPAYPRETSVIC